MSIKTFGPVDRRSLEQLERCMEAGDAELGVLCADHHPGYSQPIGGAVAYEGHVSPSGVGYDIGCGNKAALTDLRRGDLDALGGVEKLMGEITRRISFGVGVPAQERVDHPVLDKIRTADFAPQRKLAQLAESQLGTVGSGNHYVNLMVDEDDRVWVGVHFGSRGFGHRTASGFLALAQGLPFDGKAHEGEMDSPPVLFEIGTEVGESYIAAMELAGEYAYAARCSRSSAPRRSTRCTTTTTSRGVRSTAAARTGSCARAARPPGRARRDSSAARWGTSR
jgi:tRNA-splicing ligase RtcB (3'-phosphate/5'-hydroxy nucleic acid ligase)